MSHRRNPGAIEGPAIYVGTYAKYNDGSIQGKWLKLEDYRDADEFLVAARELHKDEADPELMFQDYQDFPKAFYSESPDQEQLEAIYAWMELSDDEQAVVQAYWEHIDSSERDFEKIQERFAGTWSSPADWAEEFLKDSGALEEIPENLRYYFDFEAYAKDAEMNGDITFAEVGGDVYAFHND